MSMYLMITKIRPTGTARGSIEVLLCVSEIQLYAGDMPVTQGRDGRGDDATPGRSSGARRYRHVNGSDRGGIAGARA